MKLGGGRERSSEGSRDKREVKEEREKQKGRHEKSEQCWKYSYQLCKYIILSCKILYMSWIQTLLNKSIEVLPKCAVCTSNGWVVIVLHVTGLKYCHLGPKSALTCPSGYMS